MMVLPTSAPDSEWHGYIQYRPDLVYMHVQPSAMTTRSAQNDSLIRVLPEAARAYANYNARERAFDHVRYGCCKGSTPGAALTCARRF
jgi:hypothetical protein